jgi:hypothetical protein
MLRPSFFLSLRILRSHFKTLKLTLSSNGMTNDDEGVDTPLGYRCYEHASRTRCTNIPAHPSLTLGNHLA